MAPGYGDAPSCLPCPGVRLCLNNRCGNASDDLPQTEKKEHLLVTFENDYSFGACPEVLAALVDTNMEAMTGYGEDPHCARAKELIRQACEAPDADVFLLAGGTQTNQVVLDMLLAPYEGVVAAATGHVACHEAGAIEFGGHKVLTVPGHEGKMHADELEQLIDLFYADDNHEHMVFPGAAYISFPTELGTLYSRDELAAIYEVCQKHEIPLFVDGARLGYALASPECDITLPQLAQLCDVFYIGGTKVGALCGEAVVFPSGNAPAHPIPRIKQHGALLAKGRLLGVQFEALFTDGTYVRIARNAIDMAGRLRALLHERGARWFLESPTNQQFIILEKGEYERLGKQICLSFWDTYDEDHVVVRLATSWATTQEDLDALAAAL